MEKKKTRDERTNKCPKHSAFIPDSLAGCCLGRVPSRLPGRVGRAELCRQTDGGQLQVCTYQLWDFSKLLQSLWICFPFAKWE